MMFRLENNSISWFEKQNIEPVGAVEVLVLNIVHKK